MQIMNIFKRNMFLMSLVVGLVAFIFVNVCRLYDSGMSLFELKDISTALLMLLCAGFVLIFGLLGIMKIQTNSILSLCNLCLIILSATFNQYIDSIVAIAITLLNVLLFVFNLRFSILNNSKRK